MAVLSPADMNAAFGAAVNSGDVENLVALYEPDALLAPEPGKRARGHAEIRAALTHLLALGGTMESRNNYCMEVGDLALLQGEWTLTGEAPDGAPFEVTSRTAEIVRRQPDGSWLYVVDHAFADD
jgi:ketosteroid isomerase-like protein